MSASGINPHDFQGVQWLSKKEYNIAISEFNEAIRNNQRDVCAYCSRGRARYLQDGYENWEWALDDYSVAIFLDPRCVKAYVGRGDAFAAEGRCDLSIEAYNEAIRLDPSQAAALREKCHKARDRRPLASD
jgi:tetratricopeptide (TPR) repeat protein